MSGPVIHLHGFPVSQPTRSVLMLLKAADVPFDFHLVGMHISFHFLLTSDCFLDIMKGEHKQDAYLALNPVGTVPVLVEGDFKLGSHISRYFNLFTNMVSRRRCDFGLHCRYTQPYFVLPN